MNDRPFKNKRSMSPFFYGNKLYEFSHKKLSFDDRLQMKSMIEQDVEAKHEIGSVLLSLEYLKKLSEVSVEVKDLDYGSLGKRSKLQNFANLIFFIFLTVAFSASGYYLIVYFKLRALS